MDVERAVELYRQGWSLRRIGLQLGVEGSTVSRALRRAGLTMRSGAPRHPASTQQILELRDQGLTMAEVAHRVEMTVPGAWTRYRRARPPKPPRLGRWQLVLADALEDHLAVGVRSVVVNHLGRSPTRSEVTAARRAAHSLAASGRARTMHVPGSDFDDKVGDRAYLILARPKVVMSEAQLRRLLVARDGAVGSQHAPHNQAEAMRRLSRSLQSAVAGCRLINVETLADDSVADLLQRLTAAEAELHRLQGRLERRVRRATWTSDSSNG